MSRCCPTIKTQAGCHILQAPRAPQLHGLAMDSGVRESSHADLRGMPGACLLQVKAVCTVQSAMLLVNERYLQHGPYACR